MLDDCASTDRLALAPGVTFMVGGTRVECVEIDVKRQMSKVKSGGGAASVVGREEFDSAGVGVGSELGRDAAAPQAIEMPRLLACPACLKDVSGVPVAARFCPKCGKQLPSRDAAGYLIPPEESSPLYPVYQALREELASKLSDEPPAVASSMIILAYANAMLNLGWKYEHGRGIMRNVEEAARCYEKAGKLSEAWGRA
jgi:hypothetical protein